MFLSKLFRYFTPLFSPLKKIKTLEDLSQFLSTEIAKGTGELIMKYSQKRLGRYHYSFLKEDSYAKELVHCQIKLHAKIVPDIGHLIAKLLHFNAVEESLELQKILTECHQDYILTAPQKIEVGFKTNLYFLKNDIPLKEITEPTGKYLFQLLPMTDDLLTTNVSIFQGQVRFLYIHILQSFSKKADLDSLRKYFS